MRDPIADWLGRVVPLIREANDTLSSCLSEHDETQFAEVPATLLAAADRRYLSAYTSLLGVWDLGHAVTQFEAVSQLVERHGINADTDALAAAIADWV